MKQPKYPCRNCKYFKACGDNTRTMPCKGRETNKKGDKNNDHRRIKKLDVIIIQ